MGINRLPSSLANLLYLLEVIAVVRYLPILLVLALAWAVAAEAEEVPPSRGYVSDYAEVIDAKTEIALTYLLGTMEQRYHSKIAILTVDSLAGAEPADYAAAVFREWGLSPDDLLFLVAVEEGVVYLEPGRRLGRKLTDERLKEIMDEEILPAFSEGDFSKGVLQGTVALTSAIKELEREPRIPSWIWLVVGAVLVVGLALLLLQAGQG